MGEKQQCTELLLFIIYIALCFLDKKKILILGLNYKKKYYQVCTTGLFQYYIHGIIGSFTADHSLLPEYWHLKRRP